MFTSKLGSLLYLAGLRLPILIGTGSLSLALTEIVRAQQRSSDGIWQEIDAATIPQQRKREIIPQAYRTFRLEKEALQQMLRRVPLEFTEAARNTEVVMTLPMPDGRIERFRIEESPIMAPELAARFPEIRTYRGQGIDDRSATLRFDITPVGFHAQVLSAQETVYVDPYAKGDAENYISYFKRDLRKGSPFECLVGATVGGAGVDIDVTQMAVPLTVPPNGATLRTYRLALAATGEYTIAAGGTVPVAMARITTSMNRVNGIYERELALRMTLVANNNVLIYTDPNTDPYTNGDVTAMMAQNQANLDSVIGPTNYDMGHVFGTSGGGTARIRSTCSGTFKGSGATGLPSPVGDPFDVDYVAHEMGHQHGGLHTFNTTAGFCSTFRNPISAFEPASGSTPMSYVGTCAPANLQPNAHDYFHVRTLEEIVVHMTGAGNCAAQAATGNIPPAVSAGASFTIPRNTPFTLTASASDGNCDPVTYAWEEYDLGPSSPPEGDADGMARPIFRTYPPTTSPARTFPRLQYILNNSNVPPATYDCGFADPCLTGESLPNIARTMNFQVTARDNRAGGGGIVSATMQVSVNAGAGPFVITQPNTAVSWTGGTTQTVLWDVAGTNAAPISAATVNILLSTDGGTTFPFILAAGTANDGTELITVPNLPTAAARIKVEAVGNIFFDISGANFTIAGGGPTPTPAILGNIATRLRVETGDNILIGGFIITGTQPKKVIVRAIGPSLSSFFAGTLADPTLELRNSTGALIASNNNWRDDPMQEAEIILTGLQPSNNLESAIVATLPANSSAYTAIVRGVNNATGIGVVEAYDLDRTVNSKLANISTRGLVQTGDNFLIGGLIVLGQNSLRVIVRATGPSLPLPGALGDPTLSLHDGNGALIVSNDDWRCVQEAEILLTGLQPSSNLESAIVRDFVPGNYTAIVRGANNTTGVAVVEAYNLN